MHPERKAGERDRAAQRNIGVHGAAGKAGRQMKEQFVRSALLLKESGIERLNRAHVAVFGIGGVGGFAVEALARAGIGHFLLVDNDEVSISNLNRQIIATWDTVGEKKTQAMKARILSINPDAEIETKECFFLPEKTSRGRKRRAFW